MGNLHRTAALAAICAAGLLSGPARADDDVAQIQKLEADFARAVEAKDVPAVMQTFVHDGTLVAFDVNPPRQHVGWDDYRNDWQGWLGNLAGPISYTVDDLHVVVDGTLAYGTSVQRGAWTEASGAPFRITLRVTDVYRKIDGRWLVVHEHISVPVDLGTDKADLTSAP